uniref:NDR1/HIN1-like protein 13 n=1 Tax=Erigeron canadensis TaxID=72917 RepID=UPI001CB97256|nr:NDR1/HIN1-like protein 13 [Erigeron canadensis]
MEGREYSSTDDIYSENHNVISSSDDEEEDDLLDSYNGTYVIQVPKDQIYRVPPPENAIFAEARRIAVPEKTICFSLKCVLLYALILSLIITFITGISLAIADTNDPIFRIRRIHVTTKGKGDNKHHEFEFTLRSKNTNNRAVLSFKKGGKVSLSYRERRIAKAKFPSFEQDTNSFESMNLELESGSGRRLPKVVQKSINGTSYAPIRLSLGFNVPLSFNVGVFTVKSKKLSIVCNLKVNRLGKYTRILSQDCDYSTN